MKQKINLIVIAFMLIFFASCKETKKEEKETTQKVEVVQKNKISKTITKQEVLEIQKVWGDGIVHIGKVYIEKGDYKLAAEKQIDELYGYNLGEVLFNPTLASKHQFRTTKEGALSYFIGGNENFPEDHGFAIKPWINVRWESVGVKTEGNMAVAMGNYYFTPADKDKDDEVKVEYSFAYTKDDDNKLRIILHGSHLPYSPKKK